MADTAGASNYRDVPVFPRLTGTGGEQYGCLGETLCLDGQVNGVTWSATPDANYGAGVLLPDNVGSCFISELTFSQFAPGQTLNNINDLNAICFDIEIIRSWATRLSPSSAQR